MLTLKVKYSRKQLKESFYLWVKTRLSLSLWRIMSLLKIKKNFLSGLDPRFLHSDILISKLFLAYGSHGLVSWELGRARKARDPYRTWPWPIGAGCEICTAIQAQQLSKQSIWVKWLGEILWLRLMTARLYADGPTCHVLFPYYSHACREREW